MRQVLFAAVLSASVSACGGAPPPGLAPGAPAPAFTLPGVDGRTHSLHDYSDRRVLAVVFTSNTCPASQLYEARIQRLQEEYRGKGVAVVAVNANQPAAIQLADLAHTDVGESLEDMKVRAEHRKLAYPYLSDGETQTVTKQFGVATTPHIFVFDQARTLRYQGRIDDSAREDRVTSRDARDAIDALLAGRPVAVERTEPVGCAGEGLVRAARARRTAGQVQGSAGHGGDGRRRRPEAAAAERHRQAADDQFLGDVVRAVRERVSRPGNDVPDVPAAQPGVRLRLGERPRGARRRAAVPSGAPCLAPEPPVRDVRCVRTAGGVRSGHACARSVHAGARTERRRRVSGAGRGEHPTAAPGDPGQSPGRSEGSGPAGLLVHT